MKDRLVHISLFWHSPYTNPPEGHPRVLLDKVMRESAYRNATDPDVARLKEIHKPGGGYSWGIAPVKKQKGLPWTKRRKANTRKRNLRKRIEKKYPLFFDQMYAEALARSPEYYQGETVEHTTEADDEARAERMREAYMASMDDEARKDYEAVCARTLENVSRKEV